MNIFDIVFVQPLFNVLALIYANIPGNDFGLSIIILTVLLRLAIWPLVKRQLHQVKIMRSLAPEMERIKQRTKGNRQQYSLQLMELYKRKGVNPFRSIGILIVQLPIFLALYFVIRIFTVNRDEIGKFTYDFLEKLGPVQQLISQPENFSEKLFGVVDLTAHAFSNGKVEIAIIILAAIAGYTMYIMSKQTQPQVASKKGLRQIMAEAANGTQADQAEINAAVMGKMIKILPFMVFAGMLTVPGALALYFAVSNIVGALQQHVILKQDEEEMEEIVEEVEKTHKKATAKAKSKEEKLLKEAGVTRIVAKDTRGAKRKGKK